MGLVGFVSSRFCSEMVSNLTGTFQSLDNDPCAALLDAVEVCGPGQGVSAKVREQEPVANAELRQPEFACQGRFRGSSTACCVRLDEKQQNLVLTQHDKGLTKKQ